MSDDGNVFQTPKPIKVSKSIAPDAASSLIIPPSPYMKKLGFGTGVSVYLIERFSPVKGSYKSPWAVKKISSKLKGHSEYSKRLKSEATMLKSLNHPCIIGYRSYTKCSDETDCLVMESSHKSLCDIIEDHADNELGPIPPKKALKVTKCVLSALQYLHHECHVLHGDLKSANVLIKGDFEEVKLCDFGVSLSLNEKLDAVNSEEFIGTECWSAPEVIKCLRISNKTDMFSFGLILWEMMSLSVPHLDKLNSDGLDFSLLNSDQIAKIEDSKERDFHQALGTRPSLPDNLRSSDYSTLLEMFYACTEETPESRPSAQELFATYFHE